MSSSYYDLLGVSKSDSYDKVRHSYRDLVKKHHPDVSDLPNAQERFQQIKAAYEVLNHPKKREKYNQISHNEFVSQHGGYTSEEIEKITEVQSANREAGSQTLSRSQSHDQGNQAGYQSSQNETSGASESPYNWILQGRTVETSGFAVYAIRLTAFIILTSAIFIFLQFESRFYLIAVIIIARIIYLTVFEALRKKYEKSYDSLKPDAHLIPYTVCIGILGIGLLKLAPLMFTNGSAIVSIVSIIFYVTGFLLFPIGVLGTVLAVGWGAADDYYNHQLNVRPAFWNFLIQIPIFVAIPISGRSTTLGLFSAPLLIGTIYILIYHSAVISDIISEIINRLTV